MTDFTQVLLTDSVAWELFGIAAKEGLLYRSAADEALPSMRRRALSQRVLSLLVLFDNILIHDFSNGIFRIPDLETDGIVQVVARANPVDPIQPLRTHWKRGPLKKRNRPPKSLLRSLRLFKEERALVIARLLTLKSDWERSFAAALGVSRRRFLNEFFDYALACVEGDQAVLNDTIFNQLPADMLAQFTSCLFDFRLENELLDELNAKLIFAITFADEIRIIQELSSQLGVGVATEHYHSKYASPDLDIRSIANKFVILRTAIAEERGTLPHIRDIRHAMALRSDPNLRSLRRALVDFHTSVQHGDISTIATARREVAKAKRAMARRQSWVRGLNWVTYFSLPVSIVEGLTGAPPIAGLSLAALGVTGTAVTSRVKRRHSWVVFNV